MPLTWTIGGTDKSDSVRYLGWTLAEMAERGQVGAATITVDDPNGTYLPPAQKAVTVDESSSTAARIFSGYVAERSSSTAQQAPGARQWTVTLEDANVLLDDRIITDAMGGNRPAESDRARIRWLLGLDGSACTVLSAAGITSGVLHAVGDNVDMDKVDYRGKTARDVLEDCAQKSGANFFVYTDDTAPYGLKLFYDLGTNTEWTAGLYLTDVAADVNSTTVFGVIVGELKYDPSRVYSRLRVRYKQGSTQQSNTGTASSFRTRETYRRYMRVKTKARADEQAAKWLAHASTETRSLSASVVLSASQVNLIRAGHRVPIKLTRHGFTGYEYWRVTGRYVRQLNDTTYQVDLDLKDKVKPTRFFAGPDVSVDEEFSNATDTSTADAAGVTIDADSITVRNSNGTTIIDGSSAFWSILATGSLTIPKSSKKGLYKQSAELTIPGVTTDPVTFFATTADSRDGTGQWGHFLPELSISGAGTILRALQGRARYASGTGSNTLVSVQVTRFSSTASDPAQTVKYWVFDKRTL